MSNFCLHIDQKEKLKALLSVRGVELANADLSVVAKEFKTAMFDVNTRSSDTLALTMAKGFKASVLAKSRAKMNNWLKRNLSSEIRNHTEDMNKRQDMAVLNNQYYNELEKIQQEYKDKNIDKQILKEKERLLKKEIENEVIKIKNEDLSSKLLKRLPKDANEAQLDSWANAFVANMTGTAVSNEMSLEFIKEAKILQDIKNKEDARKEIDPNFLKEHPFGYSKEYFAQEHKISTMKSLLIEKDGWKGVLDKYMTIGVSSNILGRIPSVVLNITSNTIKYITDTKVDALIDLVSGVKRFQHPHLIKARQEIIKQYEEFGTDLARNYTFSADSSFLGEKDNAFNSITSKRNITNKLNGLIELQGKGVLKYLMGYPDIVSAGYRFTNSLSRYIDIGATMAQKKGDTRPYNEIAEEIMYKVLDKNYDESGNNADIIKDIKLNLAEDAKQTTFTEDNLATQWLNKARYILDRLIPVVRLGTNTYRFVKVPTNLASLYLRGNPISALAFIANDLRLLKKSKNPIEARRHIRNMAMTVGFNVLALLLGSLFDDEEDYIPPYELASSKDHSKVFNGGGVYNSIKINGYWVQLDDIPLLGSAISNRILAKRYGLIYGNYKGSLYSITKFPILGDVIDTIVKEFSDIDKENLSDKNIQSVEENSLKNAVRLMWGYVPFSGAGSNMAQTSEPYKKEKNFWQLHLGQPVALNDFGKPNVVSNNQSIGSFITAFFGMNKIKQSQMENVFNELDRLKQGGEKTTIYISKELGDLDYLFKILPEQKATPIYNSIKEKYLIEFNKTISTTKYKKMTKEKQAKTLSQLRYDVIDTKLKQYKTAIKNYKAKEKK